ncbi:MAG: heme lyase CcmF/NrfE family subunit [Bdellovibrionales bacterium]|nr:heme lyase CcmF/NrfE family subunit [Bdellovibrionales bacterium]
MVDVGHFSLVAAFLFCVWGLIGGVYGATTGKRSYIRSAGNSVVLCGAFSVVAFIALAIAFVTHDYNYIYVWQHSNNAMHPVYRISAIWGGMDGSMLLWAMTMSVFSALVVLKRPAVERATFDWIPPVLSGATGFFLFVTTFLTNPFRVVPAGQVLTDGKGLNPLLQNPSMMIHPPMLYLGFTGFVVPFAFCLAALLSGRLGDSWIRATRRWTLVAWAFLTTGIVLGGNWAYIELGWGGFWAWDPVENASFLPWLTGTAYLHSVMVQEQRGMLKVWNVCLSIATYLLTVFGTFLTRSGVVQSVHAFAENKEVGWIFLGYIVAVGLLGLVLLLRRRKDLRPENPLESYFSREAAFLFNNLALLGICFATFWGVMFPIISEAVAGEKAVVGPPFFNKVNVPLFLALLFLMGVGPLIAWRRSSVKLLVRAFVKPLVVGSGLTVLFLALDPTRISAAVSFGLCLFVLLTIEAEFRRAVKIRRAEQEREGYAASLVQVVRRKPRRYGGFLVHLGVALMAIAITASMAYKIERDISLKPGESTEVGRYRLTLDRVEERDQGNYNALVAHIKVSDAASGDLLEVMHPERRAYTTNQEVTTEVDLRVTPLEDLYLAMAGLDAGPVGDGTHSHAPIDITKATVLLKVFINPLQVWLWFGSVVVLFGTGIVFFQGLLEPSYRRASLEASAVARAG